MSSMRPAKRAKLDLLEDTFSELRSLVQAQEEELRRKDKALQAAMKIVCSVHIPRDWSSMPEALRNDPTALTQGIVSNFFFLKTFVGKSP